MEAVLREKKEKVMEARKSIGRRRNEGKRK
jgi:hypothetical protein